MGDGDDSGCYIPGEPHEGAQGHENAHPEQVQMVASSLLHGAGGGWVWGEREVSPKRPFLEHGSMASLGIQQVLRVLLHCSVWASPAPGFDEPGKGTGR